MKKFLSLAMSLLLCLNYSFIPIQAEEGDAAHSQGETPQEISGENNEEVSEESNPVIEKDDNSSDEGEELLPEEKNNQAETIEENIQ